MLVGRRGPAHARYERDRGFPLDTVAVRLMWHVGGTAKLGPPDGSSGIGMKTEVVTFMSYSQ